MAARDPRQSATKIKRLTSLGYDPGRIAAILCIRRAEIADFLERLEPARPERTGDAGLTRPRTRREQGQVRRNGKRRSDRLETRRRLREERFGLAEGWNYRDVDRRAGDDDLAEAAVLEVPAPPAIAAAELVRAEGLGADRAAAELPPAPPATSPEDWECNRPWGAADPCKRHDAAQAERARALRASGAIRKAIAEALGCSVATVGRLLAAAAHDQGPRALHDEDRPDPPPAIAAAELTGASPPRPAAAGWDDPTAERMKWIHAKLSFEDAERMRQMRSEGTSWKVLQEVFGVSKATVCAILAGKRYTAPPREVPVMPAAADRIASDDGLGGLEAWPGLEPTRAEVLEPIETASPAPRETCEGPVHLWARRPELDDQASVRALEMHAAGMSWASIGRELGVKGDTAKAAAWRRGAIGSLIATGVHALPDRPGRGPRPPPSARRQGRRRIQRHDRQGRTRSGLDRAGKGYPRVSPWPIPIPAGLVKVRLVGQLQGEGPQRVIQGPVVFPESPLDQAGGELGPVRVQIAGDRRKQEVEVSAHHDRGLHAQVGCGLLRLAGSRESACRDLRLDVFGVAGAVVSIAVWLREWFGLVVIAEGLPAL